MNKIITISREFGSGGRELGKRLADEMGFLYFDKEIITQIAKKTGLDEGYIEQAMDRSMVQQFPVTFGRTFTLMPMMDTSYTEIFAQQHNIINELAGEGDCVIVGRGADVILSDYNPFRIFVYANMTSKISRCKERASEGEDITSKKLEDKIKQVDKARAKNHDLLSDIPWGDKRGYNLCINTTGADIKTLVLPLSDYIKSWFDE